MPETNNAERPTPVGVQRVVGLRIALGEEFDYWRDTFPAERHYARFERLEYQTSDGRWHNVPSVWVGRHDSPYDPEKANAPAHAESGAQRRTIA
jgi:hypothetical protein